jgi:hypothetical protein
MEKDVPPPIEKKGLEQLGLLTSYGFASKHSQLVTYALRLQDRAKSEKMPKGFAVQTCGDSKTRMELGIGINKTNSGAQQSQS